MSDRLTPTKKIQLKRLLSSALIAIDNIPADKSCYTCDKFDREEYCTHYDSNVPAEHRGLGCKKYKEEIPF